jgi:hypothetical protein
MVRTLTIVSVLALLAGLALGVFAAHAADWVGAAPTAAAPASASLLDEKVERYRVAYHLDAAKTLEVRLALREYEQGVSDALKRLRAQNPKEFTDLRVAANKRLDKVIAGAKGGDR